MTGRTTSFCTVTSPDKAKQNYFLFLITSLYILSEIKLCAESQKHFLSFQNSYLVNNNNTTLYQFSLLEAATKPNLSSFSAGLAAALHTQTSLELGRQTRIPQTTAWAWSLWHPTVAWPVIWFWGDVWPVTRACIWPHQWPPLDINMWIMPDDKM